MVYTYFKQESNWNYKAALNGDTYGCSFDEISLTRKRRTWKLFSITRRIVSQHCFKECPELLAAKNKKSVSLP
ncbi:MAG: hypothetical protein ABIO76_12420 [Ginsengibacter sp.]